jgi:ATP/maltotriose-dependent transcriptional regulator MalT
MQCGYLESLITSRHRGNLPQRIPEPKIARSLGRLAEAANVFRQLSEECQVRDLHHEVVMVSLDLAEVQVARGDYDEAEKLAAQVYSNMANWGLHRPGLAAWLVFQNALELRKFDEVFTQVRRYYLRHWHTPAPFSAE